MATLDILKEMLGSIRSDIKKLDVALEERWNAGDMEGFDSIDRIRTRKVNEFHEVNRQLMSAQRQHQHS